MSGGAAFRRYLDAHRREIDAALERALPAPPACPPRIAEAMRYSVLAGGKRFRPILTLAAAEAVRPRRPDAVDEARDRGEPEAARPRRPGPTAPDDDPAWALAVDGACAIELVHTYSLVHDDLPAMDDDDLRRGLPTSHKVFGEGLAILVGDALLTQAFALLSGPPLHGPPGFEARRLRAVARLAEAAGATGMVGGQAVDLTLASGGGLGLSDDPEGALRCLHERKTGALIRAAAVVGAILAGGGETAVRGVDAYAAHLGLAFQIVDDILDVEGSTAQLGKTAGKDAAARKPTYPSVFGLDRSRALAADAADAARDALASAGLEGRLGDIAEWVLSRTS